MNRLPLGWLWDPNDMPSGNSQPTKADRIWRAEQQRMADAGQIRICTHCGRGLHDDETDYCRLCNVDISQDSE